jgi:hypothetical protein
MSRSLRLPTRGRAHRRHFQHRQHRGPKKKVSWFCVEFFRVITRNEHFTGTLSSIETGTNSVTDTVYGDGVIFLLQENKGTKHRVANEFSTAILLEAKISSFPLPTPGDHSLG